MSIKIKSLICDTINGNPVQEPVDLRSTQSNFFSVYPAEASAVGGDQIIEFWYLLTAQTIGYYKCSDLVYLPGGQTLLKGAELYEAPMANIIGEAAVIAIVGETVINLPFTTADRGRSVVLLNNTSPGDYVYLTCRRLSNPSYFQLGSDSKLYPPRDILNIDGDNEVVPFNLTIGTKNVVRSKNYLNEANVTVGVENVVGSSKVTVLGAKNNIGGNYTVATGYNNVAECAYIDTENLPPADTTGTDINVDQYDSNYIKVKYYLTLYSDDENNYYLTISDEANVDYIDTLNSRLVEQSQKFITAPPDHLFPLTEAKIYYIGSGLSVVHADFTNFSQYPLQVPKSLLPNLNPNKAICIVGMRDKTKESVCSIYGISNFVRAANSAVIGSNNTIGGNSRHVVALGANNSIGNSSDLKEHSDIIIIGNNSSVQEPIGAVTDTIIIGTQSHTNSSGNTIVGRNSTAASSTGCTIIGNNTTVNNSTNSVFIRSGASELQAYGGCQNSVILGNLTDSSRIAPNATILAGGLVVNGPVHVKYRTTNSTNVAVDLNDHIILLTSTNAEVYITFVAGSLPGRVVEISVINGNIQNINLSEATLTHTPAITRHAKFLKIEDTAQQSNLWTVISYY